MFILKAASNVKTNLSKLWPVYSDLIFKIALILVMDSFNTPFNEMTVQHLEIVSKMTLRNIKLNYEYRSTINKNL